MGDCNAADESQTVTLPFSEISSTTLAAFTFKFIIFSKSLSYENTCYIKMCRFHSDGEQGKRLSSV